MTFLGIVNGIENQIECHLLHSFLITDHILGQNLVSFNLGDIVQNRVVVKFLIYIIQQLLELFNFHQFNEHLIFINVIREVWFKNESYRLVMRFQMEIHNVLDFL